MATFYHLLVNNLVASITNYTVWFALTFYVYLQTKSVFATGMIAGIYLVLVAASGIWFGSLVDHHRKKLAMLGSSVASFGLYAASFATYQLAPKGAFAQVSSAYLWAFVCLVMLGVICGGIRNIALPTLVTVLIPEERRDKANGLVGMVTGVGILTTSVMSGLLVAWGGMFYALLLALGLVLAAFLHLAALRIDEPAANASPDGARGPRRVDLKGTIRVVTAVPGLPALILFAALNNLLGGVFVALIDPYGLSLVRVEVWGLLGGILSSAFILAGLAISRKGLGRNPLRTLLLVNLITWSVCSVFTVQDSVVLLVAGSFVWMFFIPYAEAAEHTMLQKVVPFERQGRVFGFAQSVEQAASPFTAFLISPLTQFVFIPLMTTGAGAAAIGDWYGRGSERGIAVVFTLTGLIGVVACVLAFNSRYYRQLSAAVARDAQLQPAPA